MNKQELIEKYKELENSSFDIAAIVVCQLVLKDLEQLDEPKPVKVKQFVADWYEENKDSFEFNVWDWIAFRDEAKKSENREFNNWINNTRENPIQTLVNMHNFGYEVEKEKRYLVTLKNRQPLVKSQSGSTLYFSQDITARNYKGTQKELEDANFGWVFDCEGIEIEEVE
ncbi:phage protein [Streptococcus pneumoniae]|nr:phage protein [Streptococcus pneumoniae]VKS82188.1 phage protein [Streptococcus pneumoniae]